MFYSDNMVILGNKIRRGDISFLEVVDNPYEIQSLFCFCTNHGNINGMELLNRNSIPKINGLGPFGLTPLIMASIGKSVV